MTTIIAIIQIIAATIALVAALISIVLFIPFRWPAPVMWGMKIFVSVLSPILGLTGLLIVLAGITTGSVFLISIGTYIALVYMLHIWLVTRPPVLANGFENTFIQQKLSFNLPKVPEPHMKQDIPFATIPGTGRRLLCDLWQPGKSIQKSGLAFIFMHGSAFYILDKDTGTRPLFRQLTARGHVVMDVAYRLAPETDLMGMVHDVKRAIAWMKENAGRYSIDPEKIVVGGGSAGGHLALMAAYTINDSRFTPPELEGRDFSVCGVVAEYPSADLKELYFHTNQHLTTREKPGQPKKKVPKEIPSFMKKRLGKDYHRLGFDKNLENVGFLAPLMGGHPDEVPDRYEFLSPVSHVHPDCPPTLLIHGTHDIMAPVTSTRKLVELLEKNNVPYVTQFLPQTDHAFDMALPGLSPAAHTAISDVQQFLDQFIDRRIITFGNNTVKRKAVAV